MRLCGCDGLRLAGGRLRVYTRPGEHLQAADAAAMCSYFVHLASTPAEEHYGKEALVRYFEDA